MRISDWSSDVCSSDLALWVAAVEQGQAVFAEQSGALETALAEADQQRNAAAQERNIALATVAALSEQCETLRHQVAAQQAREETEIGAKNQALQDGQDRNGVV